MAKRIHANGKASVQARFNISVINPIIVKALLRVEGKSDQGDAMTLARLAARRKINTTAALRIKRIRFFGDNFSFP